MAIEPARLDGQPTAVLGGCAPGCDFGASAPRIRKLCDHLKGGLHVCVGGHQDAHVILATDGHHREVDGQRDVDALLTRSLAWLMSGRPSPRVEKRPHVDERERVTLPVGCLPQACGIAAWVARGVRQAAVDAYLLQLTVERAVSCELLGESNRVDLAFPVGRAVGAECFPRTLADVLPVEEHNHPGRHRQPPVKKIIPASPGVAGTTGSSPQRI